MFNLLKLISYISLTIQTTNEPSLQPTSQLVDEGIYNEDKLENVSRFLYSKIILGFNSENYGKTLVQNKISNPMFIIQNYSNNESNELILLTLLDNIKTGFNNFNDDVFNDIINENMEKLNKSIIHLLDENQSFKDAEKHMLVGIKAILNLKGVIELENKVFNQDAEVQSPLPYELDSMIEIINLLGNLPSIKSDEKPLIKAYSINLNSDDNDKIVLQYTIKDTDVSNILARFLKNLMKALEIDVEEIDVEVVYDESIVDSNDEGIVDSNDEGIVDSNDESIVDSNDEGIAGDEGIPGDDLYQ